CIYVDKSAHLLALHSFPPRRSSDLTEQRGGRWRHPPAMVLTQAVKHVDIEDLPEGISHKAGGGNTRDKQVEVHQRVEALPAAHVDRKSTRLNSSHVKISYAVFCLKK